jgi:hypothetical protein
MPLTSLAPAVCGALLTQALARALESHIVVYCVGLPVLEMGEEHKGEWVGGCVGQWGHVAGWSIAS